MNFVINPYVGALPLSFGMSPEEIEGVLNKNPIHHRAPGACGGARDDYEFVSINYDKNGKAAEFCFAPVKGLVLSIDNQILIGPNAISNPGNYFRELDPNPEEKLGFLVFKNIGINTAGYHDNDKSQRAINIFQKGHWDHI